MHEVHRPNLIDGDGFGQRLRPFAHQALSGFDAQVQFQLPIDPVDPLTTPPVALDVAQVEEAQPEAPVAPVGRQPDQPVGNLVIFRRRSGSISVTGLADVKRFTCQANADVLPLYDTLRHLPPMRWRYHFFASASATISAFSRSSAYIF